MATMIEGKVYTIGKIFNKAGDCYTLYQKLTDGVIYYNIYKDNEKPAIITCPYLDITYLFKVKGF